MRDTKISRFHRAYPKDEGPPIEHRAPTISWEGPAGVLVNGRIAQWAAATISALKGPKLPPRPGEPGRPCSVPCVRPVLRALRSAGPDLATWRRSPALSSESPTNLNAPATHGCIKPDNLHATLAITRFFVVCLGSILPMSGSRASSGGIASTYLTLQHRVWLTPASLPIWWAGGVPVWLSGCLSVFLSSRKSLIGQRCKVPSRSHFARCHRVPEPLMFVSYDSV
jgi:hypothetical protein